MHIYKYSMPRQRSEGSASETRSGAASRSCYLCHIADDHPSTPALHRLTASAFVCRATSGASENVVIQRKGRAARQRVKNGQALMPTLKYLFRLAGPKILTLLALAVARTLLSNRLARLQVYLGLVDGCLLICGRCCSQT